MAGKVKAIRIRSQLHEVSHNVMSGYKTLCGKMASFGHSVYQIKPEEITCPECTFLRRRNDALSNL
jgi:hypothetical protein